MTTPLTTTEAIKALFANTSGIGVAIDTDITVLPYTSTGRTGIAGVEIHVGSDSVSIPRGSIRNLIAALQAAEES